MVARRWQMALLVQCGLVLSMQLGMSTAAQADPPAVIPPQNTIQVPRDPTQAQASVISTVAISPDGSQLAAAGDDHFVRVWSVNDGRLLRVLRGHQDWVRSVSFSRDGRTLISAGEDRSILFWDVQSGEQLRALSLNTPAIYATQFDPQGALFGVVGFTPKLSLFNTEGNLQLELDCPCRDMRALAFSPDSRTLAAVGQDGRLTIWDATNGQRLHQIQADRRRLRSVEFSPDGSKVAVGGEGLSVSVFDVRSGELLHTLPSRPGRVLTMLFLDNDRLVTGGTDNMVRVWDLPNQSEALRLVGHTGTVTSLALDRARNLLISGSYDTTIMFWNLDRRGPGNTATLPGFPTR